MKKHLTSLSKFGQRGDTIVEVLICIAIVSLILGGAFVTTNNSSLGVRDAQEHGEALKLVGSELEQLRGDASSANPTVFTISGAFCMYNETAVSTAGPTVADCVQDSSGAKATVEPKYSLSITRAASINTGYVFTIQAKWSEVTGKGNGNETMVYRLYQ